MLSFRCTVNHVDTVVCYEAVVASLLVCVVPVFHTHEIFLWLYSFRKHFQLRRHSSIEAGAACVI